MPSLNIVFREISLISSHHDIYDVSVARLVDDWCPITAVDGAPVHDSCYTANILFTLLTGTLVNGPYALITTAVSAELGQ